MKPDVTRGTLSIKQACERFSLSRTAIFQMFKQGSLQPIKLSARKVLVATADIEKVLTERAAK